MHPLSPYDDPLTYLAEPPHDETDEAREARLLAEQEARQISDEIDDQINQERLATKKGPKPVKVLLLGACAASEYSRFLVDSRVRARALQARANQVCGVFLRAGRWGVLNRLLTWSEGKSTTLKSTSPASYPPSLCLLALLDDDVLK